MIRYRGFLSIIIRLFLVVGIVMLSNILATNYDLSAVKQIENVYAYAKNKKSISDNNISIANYNSSLKKLSDIYYEIRKNTSITEENRDNFLGFAGQCVKKYNLNIKSITYVDINEYVKENYINKQNQNNVLQSDKPRVLAYNSNIIDNILKNSVGVSVAKTATSTQQAKTPNPQSNQQNVQSKTVTSNNGILIELSGDSNIYGFIMGLESYNFKYLIASIENTKDVSNLRLLIDLR